MAWFLEIHALLQVHSYFNILFTVRPKIFTRLFKSISKKTKFVLKYYIISKYFKTLYVFKQNLPRFISEFHNYKH